MASKAETLDLPGPLERQIDHLGLDCLTSELDDGTLRRWLAPVRETDPTLWRFRRSTGTRDEAPGANLSGVHPVE